MTKVAVFVEGLTETELTVELLISLCGRRGIAIDLHKQCGGTLHFLESRGANGAALSALVANCSTDGQVKTQILDRYSGLVAQGYTRIIGVRDVYPFLRGEIPALEAGKHVGLPTGPVPIDLHFAEMEVEAWFLDEITHFERIHAGLTVPRLVAAGFDVANCHGDTWDHPAATLNAIYQLEGRAWRKTGGHIRRTVQALCMESLYTNARSRSASLSAFLRSLEAALFPPIQSAA